MYDLRTILEEIRMTEQKPKKKLSQAAMDAADRAAAYVKAKAEFNDKWRDMFEVDHASATPAPGPPASRCEVCGDNSHYMAHDGVAEAVECSACEPPADGPVVEIVTIPDAHICSNKCYLYDHPDYGCHAGLAVVGLSECWEPTPDCPGPGKYRLVRVEDNNKGDCIRELVRGIYERRLCDKCGDEVKDILVSYGFYPAEGDNGR